VDRFINESIDYFDLQRVGGLKSHLQKTHKNEIKQSGIVDSSDNEAVNGEFHLYKKII